jgi:hypothetical protein
LARQLSQLVDEGEGWWDEEQVGDVVQARPSRHHVRRLALAVGDLVACAVGQEQGHHPRIAAENRCNDKEQRHQQPTINNNKKNKNKEDWSVSAQP